jgi:SAM-dependent methyltransferase
MNSYKCRGCLADRLAIIDRFRYFPSAAQAFYKSRDEALEDRKLELPLYECKECGLVQIDIDPVSYYKSVITAASIGDASRSLLKKEWEPLLQNYGLQGSRLLEVGAGAGDFVRLLRSWSVDAIGLEFNVKNTSKDVLIDGWLPQTRLDKSFKAIVCNNFLEHHPSPKNFLRAIHDLIEEEGYLYISVPRFEYLYEKACFYELVPDHLSYFSKQSLFNILSSSGFNVKEYYTKNNENDHVVFCQKRPSMRIVEQLSKFDSIVKSLRQFIEIHKADGRSIAVWGAGHRTLTLLSMAAVDGVEKIVDSAPFKQGLFAPVTGIPIISPEDFQKCPTDLLVLMLPGAYAQQVQSYLSACLVAPTTYLFQDSTEIRRI